MLLKVELSFPRNRVPEKALVAECTEKLRSDAEGRSQQDVARAVRSGREACSIKKSLKRKFPAKVS
jgi:hypothetical protein